VALFHKLCPTVEAVGFRKLALQDPLNCSQFLGLSFLRFLARRQRCWLLLLCHRFWFSLPSVPESPAMSHNAFPCSLGTEAINSLTRFKTLFLLFVLKSTNINMRSRRRPDSLIFTFTALPAAALTAESPDSYSVGIQITKQSSHRFWNTQGESEVINFAKQGIADDSACRPHHRHLRVTRPHARGKWPYTIPASRLPPARILGVARPVDGTVARGH